MIEILTPLLLERKDFGTDSSKRCNRNDKIDEKRTPIGAEQAY